MLNIELNKKYAINFGNVTCHVKVVSINEGSDPVDYRFEYLPGSETYLFNDGHIGDFDYPLFMLEEDEVIPLPD